MKRILFSGIIKRDIFKDQPTPYILSSQKIAKKRLVLTMAES
jgi:hypothetical protein